MKFTISTLLITCSLWAKATPYPLMQYDNPTVSTNLTTSGQLSGITFNPDAGEYVTVNQGNYCRLDANFNELYCGNLACYDCEDIVYLGEGNDYYEYALVEESGPEGSVYIVQAPKNTHNLRVDSDSVQTLTYEATNGGDSGEGIAFDALNGVFYVCIEDPEMKVLAFERPAHFNDLSYNDPQNLLVVTEALSYQQLSNILGANADLSSCYFNPNTQRLWLMSDIAHEIVDVGLDGQLHDVLTLADEQFEGFTFSQDFSELIVTHEPRGYQRYFALPEEPIFANGFEVE